MEILERLSLIHFDTFEFPHYLMDWLHFGQLRETVLYRSNIDTTDTNTFLKFGRVGRWKSIFNAPLAETNEPFERTMWNSISG
jgi:hypothetical protein